MIHIQNQEGDQPVTRDEGNTIMNNTLPSRATTVMIYIYKILQCKLA